MKVVHTATRSAVVEALGDVRTVVTIGAYDGVHRGHRAVIGQVCDYARNTGACSVVVTFDRHPASVVRPESAPKLLTDVDQKMELLESTGVDATLVVPFDAQQSSESPVDFVQRVLVDALRVKGVIVGEDFHFGHKRGGNVAMLRDMSQRHDYTVLPVVLIPRGDGVDEPVSSTAIRRALAGGDVQRAADMLGRLHEVRGVVGGGDQRGRTIGFPTANVMLDSTLCVPADGVYAARVAVAGADGAVVSSHMAAVNLGRRPTFHEHAEQSLLEAHLLDFDGDLYGRQLRVAFHSFVRGERKFTGIEELRAQLQLDIAHVRAALA
ncbi:MAG: bifunctional riboflavin kinase/FAD synthetase [Ilumatobacteraceae bacterium]